jgi:hypothetical protein
MSEKFGEVLMQVYSTPRKRSSWDFKLITPPVTKAPSTPCTLTRPPGVPSAQPSRSFVHTPTPSENKFATLPLNYQSREASVELDIDNPLPTRKSMRITATIGLTK